MISLTWIGQGVRSTVGRHADHDLVSWRALLQVIADGPLDVQLFAVIERAEAAVCGEWRVMAGLRIVAGVVVVSEQIHEVHIPGEKTQRLPLIVELIKLVKWSCVRAMNACSAGHTAEAML